jgi:hypothetical protein
MGPNQLLGGYFEINATCQVNEEEQAFNCVL